MDELGWALWGLGGAVAYAAPRLGASLFDPPDGSRRLAKSVWEFATSVLMGPLVAAGIGPIVASDFFGTSIAQCRASALVIGLIVNPVAPSAVQLVSNLALARLGHPLAKKRTKP